ncbi:MAG: hypothetical protein ACJ8F3_04990 [Xanthobacteraceae bacterium]
MMVTFRKAAILGGAASIIVALVGAMLIMSQPAQSKNDRTTTGDGVSTQFGF